MKATWAVMVAAPTKLIPYSRNLVNKKRILS